MRLDRTVTVAMALCFAFALVFSGISYTIPKVDAQQQQVLGKNWENVDYDTLSTNFSPQTQITKDNIQLVELKWIFPMAPAPAAGIGGYTGFNQGAAYPLVIDGIVIVPTNYGVTYALDAGNGKQIWVYNMLLNFTADRAKGYKIRSSITCHLHGISYFEGKLWIPAASCEIGRAHV